VPHTLLLADDNVTIQRVVELTFADQAIRVIAVSNGEQAIAAMHENPPDIILADIAMPGRNGYELTEHIRATPRLAHIPVLLLAGAFEPVDRDRAMAVGCNGILSKPFEPQHLIDRVKDLLARSTPTGPSREAPPIGAPLAAQPRAEIPWDASLRDGPLLAAPVKPSTLLEVESYFDRLDHAVASMSSSPAASLATPDRQLPAAHGENDWFSAKPAPSPSDPPLSYGSPQTDFDRAVVPVTPAVPEPAVPEPAVPTVPTVLTVPTVPAVSQSTPARAIPAARIASPDPSRTAVSFPPLDEAFAALLAAEQGAPPPSAAPRWPTASAGAPAAVSNELVEQVTRLVLERLSDRVVRETVGQVVSEVAERLIREEIERIKRNIK
jgi:CheY-like chemotaxis protein